MKPMAYSPHVILGPATAGSERARDERHSTMPPSRFQHHGGKLEDNGLERARLLPPQCPTTTWLYYKPRSCGQACGMKAPIAASTRICTRTVLRARASSWPCGSWCRLPLAQASPSRAQYVNGCVDFRGWGG